MQKCLFLPSGSESVLRVAGHWSHGSPSFWFRRPIPLEVRWGLDVWWFVQRPGLHHRFFASPNRKPQKKGVGCWKVKEGTNSGDLKSTYPILVESTAFNLWFKYTHGAYVVAGFWPHLKKNMCSSQVGSLTQTLEN